MLPLKPYNLEYSIKYPKGIVLHHTAELNLNSGELIYDRPAVQITKLQNIYYAKTKIVDLPYHFILEKIGNDYQVIVGRPLLTKCVFIDVDRIYDNWIHIAILGNFDEDIPPDRLYKMLAYRVIAPYSRTFRFKLMSIVTHKEISKDDTITCPGEFFNKSKLIAQIRNMTRKLSVTRF